MIAAGIVGQRQACSTSSRGQEEPAAADAEALRCIHIGQLLLAAAVTLRRSSLRRWANRIEPRLLLVAQRGVEVLKVRTNRLDGVRHDIQPCFDRIEPRHWRLRHRGRARRLHLVSSMLYGLLEIVEGTLLLRSRLNHLFNALRWQVDDAACLLTARAAILPVEGAPSVEPFIALNCRLCSSPSA